MRDEVIGDARLFLGDCREVLAALGAIDVVLTDPPYGVGEGVGSGLRKVRKEKSKYGVFRSYGANATDPRGYL